MKLKFILLILSICLSDLCFSQIIIPEKYRELEESPANGKKMNRVIFDMDNDTKNDVATIIENTEEFSKFKLLIYLSGSKKHYEIELLHREDFAIMPVQIKNTKAVLEFGYFEDNSAFGRFFKLRFNNESKKIQVIGYDTGYRIAEGYCNKSYNLITGKFDVSISILNESKRKEIKSSDVEKIKQLYIDDLNFETLEKLDNVGKKFEPQ